VNRAPPRSPLDRTFAALADPTRRAVVDLLRAAPERAGALAEKLSASRPAMSRHLRVLRAARIVAEEPLADDGRGRVYQLRPEPFAAMRDWVVSVEAFWSDQLASFQAHVAKRAKRSAP